jgi:hypothetical protein
MGFFSFAIWATVLISLFVLGGRLLFLHLFTRFLHKKYLVVHGPRALTFAEISRETASFRVRATNVELSLNPLGLFFSRFLLFDVKIGDLAVDCLQVPRPRFVPRRTVSLNIFIQVCIHILVLNIRRFRIAVARLALARGALELRVSGASLSYSYEDGIAVDLRVGQSALSIGELFTVTFNQFVFTPSCSIDPVLSLINLEALAIPFKVKTSPISFSIENDRFQLHCVRFSFLIPRGKIKCTTPDLTGKLSVPFPAIAASVDGFSGFWSIPLSDFSNLVLDIINFRFKTFTLSNCDRPILKVKSFRGDRYGNEKWKIAAADITICYHSLTGLDIIPFLSAQLGKFVRPREHSVKLKFPNFELDVEEVALEMKLTDSATIDARSSCVSYREGALIFPSIALELNRFDVVVLRKFAVSVTADGFLGLDVRRLKFKDRHLLSIEDFLMQTLTAWRAVAPYIVRDHSLTESLPFPIRVAVSRLSWKFYESVVNASLSRASRLMPANLSDSYVREFLMRKKIRDQGPPNEATQKLMRRLKALQFREYREQLKSLRPHKCNIALLFTNVVVCLDSRGFVDKPTLLHQLDPTTHELYPDLRWEAMNGFNVEAQCTSLSIRVFDVSAPILAAHHLRITRALIVAEPKAPEAFDMALRICGRTFPALKDPMKLRMWTDLSVSCDSFYYYFDICYQALYQELMITFAQVFPYGVDPSVQLAWFDLLRAQFRGQVLFNFIRVECFRLFTREGDWSFSCGGVTCPRVYGGVVGPVLVELATTEVHMKFHWESKVGDVRRLIVFPDVSKFAAPGYDIYSGRPGQWFG